ncbi:Hpt domain-containing protein [Desulfolithobacter sp.]
MTEAMFEFDADIILEFVAESLEHLEGIDQQLMDYEQNPEEKTIIDGIFRAIHSIKGSSGFLELHEINQLSHRLETLLDLLRKDEIAVSQEIMDTLFHGCDILKTLVEEVNQQVDQGLAQALARDEEQLKQIHKTLDSILESPGNSDEDKSDPDNTEETRNGESETGYSITPQLIQEFQVEAGEHLESCDQALVMLSRHPDDSEAVNEVFRNIHSIKGTASYLGLEAISNLSHAAESILELVRRSDAKKIDEDVLDLLFETIDLLKEMTEHPDQPAPDKTENLIERLSASKVRLEQHNPDNDQQNTVTVRSSTDPLAIFLDACDQHLSTLKECIEKNRRGEKIPGEQDIMFRAAHSLKSSAQYMGFEKIMGKAGELEELLERIRNGEENLGDNSYELIIMATKDIESFLKELENGDTDISIQEEPAAETNRDSTTGKLATPPVKTTAVSTQARKTSTGATGNTAPKTMRVNQALLDTFMNLVGELIVARNAFGHIERRLEMGERERVEALKELRGASLAVARISEEMQRTVMEMRMVPIRNVFQKFPRMVRDLTRKSGKKAQIILQGEETEIDKGIAEDLADPLVHIIRNCVDHGLESPQERISNGKVESGTIILRATHEGNFIVIDIIDDGRGIDTQAVLDKAIEKGMVTREQAASLSHDEICSFIFKPGFSTAQKVTDISGRGVGMDVVMTNLKKLKGNVRVTSEQGQGTKVRLEVPLTLALVDALLVQAGEQTFAMPLEAVAETVKVHQSNLKTLMRKKAITLRGEVISVADLAELLGISNKFRDRGEELTLLILRLGGYRMGIIVDRIQRKEEIVVKPLADYLAAIPGLAGASILGDGRSILILEPGELIALATGPMDQAA